MLWCIAINRVGRHFTRNIYIPLYLYSAGRSELSDRSFDLCEFKDDPLPLGSQIRSEELKILLRKFEQDLILFISDQYVPNLKFSAAS